MPITLTTANSFMLESLPSLLSRLVVPKHCLWFDTWTEAV